MQRRGATEPGVAADVPAARLEPAGGARQPGKIPPKTLVRALAFGGDAGGTVRLRSLAGTRPPGGAGRPEAGNPAFSTGVDGFVGSLGGRVGGREYERVVEAEELWSACAEALRADVPESVWNSCFQAAVGVSLEKDLLVVAVPSTLVKERLESRWLAPVTSALADLGRPGLTVALEVRTDQHQEDEPTVAAAGFASAPAPANGQTQLALTETRADEPRPQTLNPRYTFDAFVTGASNRFAHAAALAVAETPARSYNPLFIYGVAGLGKTHLLHGIAHYVQENYPAYKVRYVSTEAFLNDYVDGIRTNSMTAFKRKYRENDVLLVDDIQFMEGKEGLQEEFFHTFNQLHGANRQIVLSSDRPPRAIATLEDRLRSRFEWGLITDIQPPDLETRLAIVRKKAEREPIPPPAEVLEFIATHITNNIRELEGALIRVSAFASLNRAPMTAELAAQVLGDILTDSQPRAITAGIILDATSKMFGFPVEELQGKSRRRPLVTARQVGMYVCRELTDLSYPAIAREYGGRDHTTVIHAVEKIGALMKERRQIYDQVTELIQSIRSG
ncbi:MAG: chromosomal replication initiator protein DnaA [Acidobacteria bacterium]|nr:chromosomal replication initiator protein DnaA [Acidobacteriota bacterium]